MTNGGSPHYEKPELPKATPKRARAKETWSAKPTQAAAR